MNEAIKYDHGKSRMDLLSPLWIEGVGHVLGFGARKYAEDNWRLGLSVRRCLGAALRHIFACLIGGNDIDQDSGCHHLLCASCELMFAYETLLLRRENDDRWRPTEHQRDALASSSEKGHPQHENAEIDPERS